MFQRIDNLKETKLAGKRLKMSFADNKTLQLWRSFMPGRKEIRNVKGPELYSVEVYPPLFFDNFDPAALFEKWAAVEMTDFNAIPDGMATLVLPAGTYAVFLHRGLASEGPKTYQYIFTEWLPNSDFLLDNRPHFALMGDKYKNDDPGSEEEIWIPVRSKNSRKA
jgi:AraC family transcriptional regulator